MDRTKEPLDHPTQEEIALAAYYLWLETHQPPVDCWLNAERSLGAQPNPPDPSLFAEASIYEPLLPLDPAHPEHADPMPDHQASASILLDEPTSDEL